MALTARFNDIYVAVTNDLIKYIDDELEAGNLQPHEADWFTDLIRLFNAEYLGWESTTNADIETYLKRFDAAGSDVRLAGHVFLHVAYDLPRMIANSFDMYPALRTDGRHVFVRPGPRFLKVFLNQMRSGVLGKLAWLAGQVDTAKVLGYWLIALRSVAWIHAEALADAANREDIEATMARNLDYAAQKTLSSWWLFGIEHLDNAELVAGIPMVDRALEYATPGVAAGTAVTAVAAMALRRRLITSAIDVLGAGAYRGMARAINSDGTETPRGARQLV